MHSLIYVVNVGTHKKTRGKRKPQKLRLLSSTKGEENRIEACFIYILDSSNSHSHFEFTFLALDATEPVSELVTQMAVELINVHLISVQQKR